MARVSPSLSRSKAAEKPPGCCPGRQPKPARCFPTLFPSPTRRRFSWMPDSRHLIFADSSSGHHYELFMADAQSGTWWPIYKQDRPALQPSVSPERLCLAYQSNLSHADVIAVPLGDGPVRTVLGSSRTEQMADASPVAPQIVYVTDRRGAQEIWIASTAEGWDRPLIQSGTPLDGSFADIFLDPVFSPDGRRVAFAAKSGSRVHVYTTFVSGGTPVRATNIDGLEDAPTWSPDGNWIAFGHIVGNDFVLGKVRPGSGEKPVDLGRIGGGIPVWSPTGEWIATHDGHGKLTLFSPDGKPPRPLPGDGGPFTWSRDGKTLYQVRVEQPALVAIDIATAKERKLRRSGGSAVHLEQSRLDGIAHIGRQERCLYRESSAHRNLDSRRHPDAAALVATNVRRDTGDGDESTYS